MNFKLASYCRVLAFSFFGLAFTDLCAQSAAEKLGYDPEDILLIIHADDLGMSHSENQASIDAWEAGAINSASIMVPCPWFGEIADYARKNPDFDLGLHLTLTAEWKNYKWDGVMSSSQIPSLLNDQMHLPRESGHVAQHAKIEEVIAELRSQVQRAIDYGIKPTHLDSHMGSLFGTPELFAAYQQIGREFEIPVFIPYASIANSKALVDAISPNQLLVDYLGMVTPSVSPKDWKKAYLDIVRNLKPGLNEIIVHLAYDDAEMQAVTIDHPDFGAGWRQRDFDVVNDPDFKNLIADRGIKLVTWRQIQQAQYGLGD